LPPGKTQALAPKAIPALRWTINTSSSGASLTISTVDAGLGAGFSPVIAGFSGLQRLVNGGRFDEN
jgi:hypothetical protein